MPTKLTVACPPDFIEFHTSSILQGIHRRIEEQVRLYPDKLALKTGELSYTYSEMNGHANSVAQAILTQCGKGLAQAAILLPNTPEMIVGMLGAMKAHKAYVPLDRNYPVDRLRAMFEDAEPAVLLTDDSHQGLAEELTRNRVPIINTSQIERHADAPDPNVDCDPLDRAYILYTSGTTGRPKGIVFLHRNLLHTTMCLTNELYFSPSDRVTWLHSASFAASVVDVYCCLTNGATLYPWDPKVQGFSGLAQWLVEQRLTTLQWIPSAFRQLMRTVPEGLHFQDIRIVVMASEPLTLREVEIFRRYFSVGSHLVNQAGTSESYNYRLYPVDHQIPIEAANVAAGYPVSPDRRVLILDDAHNEVAQGSIGEIAIKSNYMSGGYWRDTALTQAKFVQTGTDGVPVYLTGDLGQLEPDGCLIHLGRKDFQIKIRGYRIEIAEIENVLATAPGIADCACWVAKNRMGEEQLVGFVVADSHRQFNRNEVEEHLKAKLPSYMVPRTYTLLDCLPTLPNGKVDRKALPNPFRLAETHVDAGVVSSPRLEVKMQQIFGDILHLDHVTSETDFLDEGGDSLSTAVLQHRIHECFGVEIPMDMFLESPTPARLSDLIVSLSSNASLKPSLPELDSTGLSSRMTTPPTSRPLSAAMPKRAERAEPRRSFPAGESDTAGKSLVIVGAGQLGREVFTWATQRIAAAGQFRIKGFLDDNVSALEGYEYTPGVLGNIRTYAIQDGDVFVSAIGNPVTKAQCCSQIEQRGGQFVNIIHPLANVGLHVELGVGIVMGPFASITSDVKVGDHVLIGALSNVGHDVELGNWCQISSHCGVNGCATLGDGVFLGSHACILPRVKVGPWAFVGAGSIVVRDVPDRVKVFGNPASAIGNVTGP